MVDNENGADTQRAEMIRNIISSRSDLIRTATQHSLQLISRSGPHSDADDPPPPYTSTEATMPCLPGGRWDLACNIGVQNPFLQLNAMGEPTLTQVACAATDGKQEYCRDEFIIALDLPQITVTKQAYNWTCDANTDAGQLLMSKRDTISLKNLGECLLVFKRTVLTTNMNRPNPRPREDKEGCIKVESQSSNIWTITGTDIYQVEGYENDIVIRSPRFLRLWDLAKGKYRWEREGAGGQICGFTRKYILLKVGYLWLRERRTGRLYGEFRLPIYTAFTSLKEEHHFGPVMSASGLFLYKPGPKAIFIFQIDDEKVDARIWESTVDIQGRLLLRGGLDNLELELIGQKPTWKKYNEIWPIYKEMSYIRKRIL